MHYHTFNGIGTSAVITRSITQVATHTVCRFCPGVIFAGFPDSRQKISNMASSWRSAKDGGDGDDDDDDDDTSGGYGSRVAPSMT